MFYGNHFHVLVTFPVAMEDTQNCVVCGQVLKAVLKTCGNDAGTYTHGRIPELVTMSGVRG